jgi:pimeloyl-ACP methyl ester carboxylesterase
MIEKAIVFGPDRTLVGIWTEPRDPMPGSGPPAVVMINSGIVHHTGIWRLHVRMARALARRGMPSLRFDLSGIGDSDNPRDAIPLDDLTRRDVDAAIRYASETRGTERVVMMGLCSGARDSLDAAIRHRDVVGVAAIDLFAELRTWRYHAVHFGKRFFRLESWKNTVSGRNQRIQDLFGAILGGDDASDGVDGGPGPFLGVRPVLPRNDLGEALKTLLGRRVEMLFVYSGGIGDIYNHRSQFAKALPDFATRPSLTTEFFPLADHTFSHSAQQQALIVRMVEWMEERFGRPSPESAPSVEGSLPMPGQTNTGNLQTP